MQLSGIAVPAAGAPGGGGGGGGTMLFGGGMTTSTERTGSGVGIGMTTR